MKHTKIVATLAADSADQTLIRDLYERGMDVVRLNTAHMKIEELERAVSNVRAVSPKLAIMVDTKGPNIRTCNMPGEITFKKGDTMLISGEPGPGRIEVNYPPFADEVPVGSRIVCDDGAAAFYVESKKDGALVAKALFDCVMRNRKSINVPDVSLNAPALSGKDREFLEASVRLGVDLIAHSFVRSAADVLAVREALGDAGKDIGIIAKIENREGVNHLEEILNVADGVMVARGDLGIEIPLEEVPEIQKSMIHRAMLHAKPVITATQMLQSMETSPVPTRAEVSDVANAVYDGTDAVMLSGETAHGHYPREAVDMMRRIVIQSEQAPRRYIMHIDDVPEADKQTAYILKSAVNAANELPVKAIICTTIRGLSAQVVSAMRPKVPVWAFTPKENVMRRLALNYGVFPMMAPFDINLLNQMENASRTILNDEKSGLKADDLVVLCAKTSDQTIRNDLFSLVKLGDIIRN